MWTSLLLAILLVSHTLLLPTANAWTTMTMSNHSSITSTNVLASKSSPLTILRKRPTKLFSGKETNSPLELSPRRGQRLWRLFNGSRSDNNHKLVGGSQFQWTAAKVLQALAVFVISGLAEIGGGWLVWKTVREQKPWWWALIGSGVLVLYGFLPTLQPTDSFGRIYAVYGGFFIALSYAWGWFFDGMKPDLGDVVGGSLALLAVLVILFWPRQQ